MIRFSTKIRYAVRAMSDIVQQPAGTPIMMSQIAENQGISRKYLHSILTALKNAGLVKSLRGSKGGFVAGKSPAEITLSDIIKAIDGEINVVDCVKNRKNCRRSSDCFARSLWARMNAVIEETAEGITFENIRDL